MPPPGRGRARGPVRPSRRGRRRRRRRGRPATAARSKRGDMEHSTLPHSRPGAGRSVSDARRSERTRGSLERWSVARVDRWLWAVRAAPTRAASTALCRAGHVKVNEVTAKASTTVRPGRHGHGPHRRPPACARGGEGDRQAGRGRRRRRVPRRPQPSAAPARSASPGLVRDPSTGPPDEEGPPPDRPAPGPLRSGRARLGDAGRQSRPRAKCAVTPELSTTG